MVVLGYPESYSCQQVIYFWIPWGRGVGREVSREPQKQVILAVCLALVLGQLVLRKRCCFAAVRSSSPCASVFLGKHLLQSRRVVCTNLATSLHQSATLAECRVLSCCVNV